MMAAAGRPVGAPLSGLQALSSFIAAIMVYADFVFDFELVPFADTDSAIEERHHGVDVANPSSSTKLVGRMEHIWVLHLPQ